MSGDGESDDSTTIRRKILLSPTMPPRDLMDHDGSPLVSLIGQVRLLNASSLYPFETLSCSVWNATPACDQKSATSRNTHTSLRCTHLPSVYPSKPADMAPFSDWQLLASQQIPGMGVFNTSTRPTHPLLKYRLHGYWMVRTFSPLRDPSSHFSLKVPKRFLVFP
jgi:hypothetical protein